MDHSPRVLYSALESDLGPSNPGVVIPPELISPRHAAHIQMRNSLLKKWVDVRDASLVESRALDKFLSVNTLQKEFQVGGTSYVDELLLGHLRKVAHEFLDEHVRTTWSFQDAFCKGYCGPGASIGAHGDDFYTKLFSSPLTATSSGLHDLYTCSASFDPRWKAAERQRASSFGAVKVVKGNSLSFVPKSNEISRTICTEPSLNMFYQLGFGKLLENSLRKGLGIDLQQQQSRNRALARIGSLTVPMVGENRWQKGGLATIDLSSASDTVSLNLCKWLFPSWFLGPLLMLRSPVSSYKGVDIELHMISTMGNGYTFPLQTLIFGCCVAAVYELRGLPLWRPRGSYMGNFGVNGDDIICHGESYDMVVRLLTLLGFSVNSGKSFNNGSFRESCGGDFYRGHDIRGVYLERFETPQDIFSAINRLNRWSARWDTPLHELVGLLTRSIKPSKLRFVPRWESDDAGIHVPASFIKAKWRYSANGSTRYSKWTQEPKRITIDTDNECVCVPKGERSRIYNPEGLGIAFLGGYISEGCVLLRKERASYRLRSGIAPNWDSRPQIWEQLQNGTAASDSADTWRNWDSYVVANIGFDVP